MITRDQPIDMLPMRVISPLRTYQSVPFTSRTVVTRTLTYSTIPVARPRSTTSPMPTWSSATMKMPLSTSFTMFCAPKPRPAPMAAVSRVSEPSAVGASRFTISSSATMTIETLTMFCRIDPSVRVRCTSRTAARGERSSAWVSSTFALYFAPLTIRFTTRRMTSFRIQLSRNAPTMMPAIVNGFMPIRRR